jgi:membrane protease YdiL (CAAX protease family)
MRKNAVTCDSELVMAEIVEPKQSNCSLFRRVPWSLSDIVVGVCLALMWWWGVSVFSHGWLRNMPTWIVLPLGMLVEMVFLLAYPIWVVYRRAPRPACIFPGPVTTATEFAIAVPLTLGMLLVTALVSYCLIKISSQDTVAPRVWQNVATSADLRTSLMLLALGTTFAPIVEEIFCRGFLYSAVVRRSTPIVAACLQSLLFAVLHRYETMPFVIVFGGGLILAAIYEWRKTILAPIFVHAMYNFVGLAGMTCLVLINANAPALGIHGSTSANGIHVDRIEPGSAAERAGVRPGDVIVSYNGLPVTDFEHFVQVVRKGRVGDVVRIRVSRNGEALELKATLRRLSRKN